MKITLNLISWIALTSMSLGLCAADSAPPETKLSGPKGLPIIVRMQGPYDADVALQVVCYFQRTETSDTRLAGAPVELDKHLGGLIAAVRERGEFRGDEMETFLIQAPENSIKARQLLLIGLGEEKSLSLERMERVGRTALREALRLGATRVAFAPLIKDAGNNTLPAGQVETAVVRGMLLALDTEQRLQAQGLSKPAALESWVVEAGPKFYDETIAGVTAAIAEANADIAKRSTRPYSSKSK
ncbi:M17 family peptidase N-terminal domain-containing protein [Schlesneria paludicola]|uniref:M17 family peptidase N-terminal domain-containing protein n=1 Tax=Schlesneria paludicola TaxID=360056 RepID=UPI00029A3AE9|nr:M17 family peptidase N-terminal domain-containing protein [Schlesneria paludicola]